MPLDEHSTCPLPLPPAKLRSNDATPPGCLFDLEADPAEHVDLAATLPDVFSALYRTFMSYNSTYHPPVANPPDEHAQFCAQVLANDGVAGPWRRPAGEDPLTGLVSGF